MRLPSIPARSMASIILAAVLLVGIRIRYDGNRYLYGDRVRTETIVTGVLWLVAVTLLMIAAIMWVQRARWLPSDAAMFRFVAIKTLFWLNVATSYTMHPDGIRRDTAMLYLLVALTTVDLDVRLTRRFVLSTGDEREVLPWDGATDRRGPDPGRRSTDRAV